MNGPEKCPRCGSTDPDRRAAVVGVDPGLDNEFLISCPNDSWHRKRQTLTQQSSVVRER